MKLFDIKGIFGKKKSDLPIPKEEPSSDLDTLPLTRPELEPLRPREQFQPMEPMSRPTDESKVDISNVRAKLDLLLTEMDSLKTQNQMINERLKTIEKMLAEMRGIRYY